MAVSPATALRLQVQILMKNLNFNEEACVRLIQTWISSLRKNLLIFGCSGSNNRKVASRSTPAIDRSRGGKLLLIGGALGFEDEVELLTYTVFSKTLSYQQSQWGISITEVAGDKLFRRIQVLMRYSWQKGCVEWEWDEKGIDRPPKREDKAEEDRVQEMWVLVWAFAKILSFGV